MSDGREASIPTRLPRFDPQPSADYAYEVLTEVGQPFALIGKVAMWLRQPPDAQEFTKDVDFAVPTRAIAPLRAALHARGVSVRELSIGGIAVREGEIRIDFIDRREGGLGPLYEEAIMEARRAGPVPRPAAARSPSPQPSTSLLSRWSRAKTRMRRTRSSF